LNRRYGEFLSGIGVPWVDARPYIEAKLAAGGVYPEWKDYHPLAPGYSAYAEAVKAGVLDRGTALAP
jgi:hypothetical protein